jgi:hypothetical protein
MILISPLGDCRINGQMVGFCRVIVWLFRRSFTHQASRPLGRQTNSLRAAVRQPDWLLGPE